MKIVCAWCDKHMRGDQADGEISHGICPDCADKVRSPDESRGGDETPAEPGSATPTVGGST